MRSRSTMAIALREKALFAADQRKRTNYYRSVRNRGSERDAALRSQIEAEIEYVMKDIVAELRDINAFLESRGRQ